MEKKLESSFLPGKYHWSPLTFRGIRRDSLSIISLQSLWSELPRALLHWLGSWHLPCFWDLPTLHPVKLSAFLFLHFVKSLLSSSSFLHSILYKLLKKLGKWIPYIGTAVLNRSVNVFYCTWKATISPLATALKFPFGNLLKVVSPSLRVEEPSPLADFLSDDPLIIRLPTPTL